MQQPQSTTRGVRPSCAGELDFFRHIRQIQAPWPGGIIPLPTFYYEAMAIQADLLASPKRVRSFLPSRMHPLRVLPGRCVVVVAALSYADTDLGPYNGRYERRQGKPRRSRLRARRDRPRADA